MRLYQGMAEEVQFNWRTTARWALRARWAQRENEELRDALRHATERSERAEAALAERDTPCVWTCADADYASRCSRDYR